MLYNILRRFFVNSNIRIFIKATFVNLRDIQNYLTIIPKSFLAWSLFYGFNDKDRIVVPVLRTPEEREQHDQSILETSQSCAGDILNRIILLTTCIVETSEQYQKCLLDQLVILRFGPPYDEETLDVLRQTAANHMIQLKKYKEMVEKTGDLAYHHAVVLVLAGSHRGSRIFYEDYAELELEVKKQFELIRIMEFRLARVKYYRKHV